jgi:CRP-like cAMP-binding protein
MSINLDSFDNKVFIEEMVSVGHRIVCDRNQVIYNKGAQAKNLYLLEQGQIDFSEDGLSLKDRGEMFGWCSLYENGVHNTTALSNTISSVIQIPVDKVKKILDKHEETAIELHNRLESRLSVKSYG